MSQSPDETDHNGCHNSIFSVLEESGDLAIERVEALLSLNMSKEAILELILATGKKMLFLN
jgi:hypothetical protein